MKIFVNIGQGCICDWHVHYHDNWPEINRILYGRGCKTGLLNPRISGGREWTRALALGLDKPILHPSHIQP